MKRLISEMLTSYPGIQQSPERLISFLIFEISSVMALLMMLHFERFFLVVQLLVFLTVFPRFTNLAALFVRLSPPLIHNYNLASFLVGFLKPISTNQFTIKDSCSFVDWVKSHKHNNQIMCSVDVCSLFTNVPDRKSVV